MDFKDRYPELKRWPYWVFDKRTALYPYCEILSAGIGEFQAFDNSTTFLIIYDTVSEEDQTWRAFAMESPKEWINRRNFEKGLMTWTDFFQSRGWLLELKGDFCKYTDPTSRYIDSSELSPEVKERFKELDPGGSPFQILHEHLLEYWAALIKLGFNATEHQSRYHSFIKDYGHMLSPSSAVIKGKIVC
ncbi:MAG: hypothetical protein NT027_03665 [Proteobacteria bacterium]|nr:hypothetical protein [Pseudomonadota bacterium]